MTYEMNVSTTEDQLVIELERDLLQAYGPLVSGDALRQALGYASGAAFRQAVARRTVPVPIFTLPNRRGKFALVKDVAIWLATQRKRAERMKIEDVGKEQ